MLKMGAKENQRKRAAKGNFLLEFRNIVFKLFSTGFSRAISVHSVYFWKHVSAVAVALAF